MNDDAVNATRETTGSTQARYPAMPDTHWSQVLRAGECRDPAALAALCRAYWMPVHAFFRRLGVSDDEALDTTQGFFEAVLRRNDFATLSPHKGRFRSWLRTAARHHLYNERDRAKARGGRFVHVAIVPDALPSSADWKEELGPDELFDHCWARTVVAAALARLRDEFAGDPHAEIVEALLSDAPVAARAGDAGAAEQAGALRARKCRMKEKLEARYRAHLRAEIAKTVTDPRVIDDELRQLIDALRR